MSIFSKLMDTMRLTEPDDDEFYDDEEEFEEEEPAPRKKLFGRSAEREEDNTEEVQEQPKARFLPARSSANNKVVPMKRQMEVSLVKPSSMEDTREICDLLLSGKAYSMNGNLQKISNYIFIATPASVELSGDFPELMPDGSLNISGMNLHL